MKLTKEDAIKLVDAIEKIKGDDEIAHTEEDNLRELYVESCANGLYTKKEMIEIGKIVLSTKDISFARWCA